MVICLERGADLHMAQLMPLPLAVSCFSKIQIGFTFLVPAHPGSPGKRAVKRVCVCCSGVLRVADAVRAGDNGHQQLRRSEHGRRLPVHDGRRLLVSGRTQVRRRYDRSHASLCRQRILEPLVGRLRVYVSRDSTPHTTVSLILLTLGSRVVSVLDSGAEGPGFKSQPRRCRVTVLGKLFTPIVPSPCSEIGNSPLKGCGGNCEPGGK